MNFHFIATVHTMIKTTGELSEAYLQIGHDFELPFRPMVGDDIEFLEYPCKVTEVYYDLRTLFSIVRVIAHDGLTLVESEDEAKEALRRDWHELDECYPEVVLQDCFDYCFVTRKDDDRNR